MAELEATTPDTRAQLASESRLKEALTERFPFLDGHVTVQRLRRVWANVPMHELATVLVYAKEALQFDTLGTITGTDEGAELGLLYHLTNPNGIMLTLVTTAPKDGPGPSTVTPYFPLAELYEREVIDLLGVKIEGLPEGNRYPLPDGWPEGQYPLRKDWKPGAAEPRQTIAPNESGTREAK
jgi:Ni,Fe-hydrogenase III component G